MILLNHYVVTDTENKPIYRTLAPTRHYCLMRFLSGVSDHNNDWPYWVKQGYQCKNVDVNFMEVLQIK